MATKRKTPEPSPPAASPAQTRRNRTPATHSAKAAPRKAAAKADLPAVQDTAPASKRRAPARKKAAGQVTVVTQEEIAARAYSYWEARGRVNGHSQTDWLRAEQDLHQEKASAASAR